MDGDGVTDLWEGLSITFLHDFDLSSLWSGHSEGRREWSVEIAKLERLIDKTSSASKHLWAENTSAIFIRTVRWYCAGVVTCQDGANEC